MTNSNSIPGETYAPYAALGSCAASSSSSQRLPASIQPQHRRCLQECRGSSCGHRRHPPLRPLELPSDHDRLLLDPRDIGLGTGLAVDLRRRVGVRVVLVGNAEVAGCIGRLVGRVDIDCIADLEEEHGRHTGAVDRTDSAVGMIDCGRLDSSCLVAADWDAAGIVADHSSRNSLAQSLDLGRHTAAAADSLIDAAVGSCLVEGRSRIVGRCSRRILQAGSHLRRSWTLQDEPLVTKGVS